MRIKPHFRFPEVLLGILLAVAIFAIGMIFASSPLIQQYNQLEKSSDGQHAKEKSIKIGESETSDDKIARYTWWLALLTGGLVVTATVQGYFLLRADKTARIAANAARLSADAAIAAERARFYIVIESHNLTNMIYLARNGALRGENISIKYRFQNYGKTPGIVRELTLDSRIATDPADPSGHPVYITEFPEYMIGANGMTETAFYNPMLALEAPQVEAMGRNTARLWFYGRLYYDDIFGNPQVHRFYFRSVCTTGNHCILQPYDYRDHNKST